MAEDLDDKGGSDATGDGFDAAYDSFSKGEIPEEPETGVEEKAAGDKDEGTLSKIEGTDDNLEVTDDTGTTEGEKNTEGDEAGQKTEGESATEAAGQKVDSDPLKDQVEDLKRQIEELKKPKAATTETPPAKEEVKEQKPAYSADEEEILKKYQEEWGEVAKGEQLIRREEYKQLVEYVFNQVYDGIAPLIQYVQERSPKDQYRDLKTEIEDYDVVRDKAVAWVDTQPAFLQNAYKQVIENGDVKQVAELIKHYKEATGYGKSTAATDAKPTVRAVEKKADPTIQRAANALKVVKSSKSSSTAGSHDPNDFDGSFDEFAKMKQ